MKKLLLIFFVGLLATTLTGCNKDKNNDNSDSTKPSINNPVVTPDNSEDKTIQSDKSEVQAQYVIMADDGKLYYDTGLMTVVDKKEDAVYLSEKVLAEEIPFEINQSNFCDECYYQYSKQDGVIEVLIFDTWYIFAQEGVIVAK